MTPREARKYLLEKRSQASADGHVTVDPAKLWECAEALEHEANGLACELNAALDKLEELERFEP